MSASELLYHTKVIFHLSLCRTDRAAMRLSKVNPSAFRASHGYSYNPHEALKDSQRDLALLRRQRQARIRAQGAAA